MLPGTGEGCRKGMGRFFGCLSSWTTEVEEQLSCFRGPRESKPPRRRAIRVLRRSRGGVMYADRVGTDGDTLQVF